MAYYPLRNGCRGCQYQGDAACLTLDFSRMPVKRTDGKDFAVRCTSFKQLNGGSSLHAKRPTR